MDVNEANFQSAVLDRSHEVPVVVDFWAEWCAPCRQLAPVLERAIEERAGRIELAKVDTDANPGLARAFQIQGIPAVKAFRDGAVISEFTGVQPAPAVNRFLDLLLPSEVDILIDAGDEASLARAVELEPARAQAAVPLARLLHARGEDDRALAILAAVPRDFIAEGLAARITLERADFGDDQSLDRAAVAEAFAAHDAGDRARAIDLLLDLMPSADGYRDELRRVVVGILDEIPVDDPLARDGRRRLAAALY